MVVKQACRFNCLFIHILLVIILVSTSDVYSPMCNSLSYTNNNVQYFSTPDCYFIIDLILELKLIDLKPSELLPKLDFSQSFSRWRVLKIVAHSCWCTSPAFLLNRLREFTYFKSNQTTTFGN